MDKIKDKQNSPLFDSGDDFLLEHIRNTYTQFEEALAQLSILKELGTALLHINNFKRVCQTILEITIKNTVAKNCSVMLMDHDKNRLFLIAATNQDGESYIIDTGSIFSKDDVRYTFAFGEGVSGEAVAKKKPVLVKDVGESDIYSFRKDAKVKIGTILSVPLIVEDTVLGVLTLSHPVKEAFETGDINLFTIVANFAALAINSTLTYKRLQYSEEKHRILAEYSNDGITIIQDGMHEYANPSYESLTGYNFNELRAIPFDNLVSCQSGGINTSRNRIRQNKDMSGTYEAVMTKKSGTKIEIEVSYAFSVYKGRPAEIISVRDLRERKELEKRLQQAHKMEAIGTLAGGIAHDFNNTLMPIIANTQMALMEIPDGSSVRPLLEVALKAGNRAKGLVNQILTFSRLADQEQQPVQMSILTKETVKLLKSTLPSTIKIKPHIQAASDTVIADPSQLHQIVLNLCTNAAHAMREKGGELEVSLTDIDLDSEAAAAHSDLRAGRYVRLTVSDTGHGMDRAVMERIFDPFFTTKGPREGTGIGLSTVYGIVKTHGGAITVHSEPQKGSMFHVYLPLSDIVVTDEVSTTEPLPMGTKHILLVDDEEWVLTSIQLMLEGLGYKVTALNRSSEALDTFRAQPEQFDLVITDITMRDMTGEVLAKELIAIRPDIPIILCAGYNERISKEKAEEIGVEAYLMKPIEVDEMADTIRTALGKEG